MATFLEIFKQNIELFRERCKGVHFVDLGESGGELRDVEEEFSEYVRYCYGYLSKFSFFSLSPCPFSQSSFRTDSYSNEYFLAKFGFDTAENEPI